MKFESFLSGLLATFPIIHARLLNVHPSFTFKTDNMRTTRVAGPVKRNVACSSGDPHGKQVC